MHLLPEAFEDIVAGNLDPLYLEIAHITSDAVYHWLGVLITHPAYRNRAAGTAVLAALCASLPRRVVADVYSEQSRALLEREEWVRVLDGEHPIYTLEI